jgi:protoporphyrinogen oxidase
MKELGMFDKLRWVSTTMGFFYRDKLHRWGDPIALLTLPHTPLITKLRYGLFAFISTRRNSWPVLERQSAKEWITRWCGHRGYEQFWQQLFEFKFYQHADNISAAWIWTRIRRIGRSRKSIMQEELGYIERGSQTLIHALTHVIKSRGGRLHLSSPVQQVNVSDGRVTGVTTPSATYPADYVISTIPVQQVSRMVPDLPIEWKQRYDAIKNSGVCCVIFKLRRSISPHFWININDTAHEIPGVIQFSNLRPVDADIAYVPYYMPLDNPKFAWTDAQMIDDSFGCLQRINPELLRQDIIDTRVARLRHAQPICDVGFGAKIPPIQTPIQGLQVADTCFYYPEDRGIAESVRLGRAMARVASEASLTK